jgi:hypothetical protein
MGSLPSVADTFNLSAKNEAARMLASDTGEIKRQQEREACGYNMLTRQNSTTCNSLFFIFSKSSATDKKS